ncbi:hypothetical protein [Streptacidiphilus anmyonensis]|uniref:hypothetical protein n=1 Tax=Streptacidiphilus anmyonensis TaxID=405782 RepID=UPI000694E2E9|nr:hypothetical protein [Streptacidiphilus anmyonensis]
MHCTEWHYVCRSCDHRFTLPGADLSFSYGAFLGVSSTPEAVLLDAFADPAYAEIQALVSEDERTTGLTAVATGQLARTVAGSVFDPDSNRSPFTFAGTPPCPRCTSSEIALLRATETRWPGDISPATHKQWDALTSAEKAAAVSHILSALHR